MAQPNCDFIRKFHPIGQGAFYSETHLMKDNPERSVTIVYDCGATRPAPEVSKIVSQSDIKADILFLSHLHRDHYNGIQYLDKTKLKLIVLPLLDDLDLLLLKMEKATDSNAIGADYIAWLHEQFPAARIIQVTPDSQWNADGNNSQDGTVPPINDNNQAQTKPTRLASPIDLGQYLDDVAQSPDWYFEVESGSTFELDISGVSWVYIPLNPKQNRMAIGKLEEMLTVNGIDFNQLEDTEYVVKNLNKIAKAYRSLGHVNEYSMALYSGPSENGRHSCITNLTEFCAHMDAGECRFGASPLGAGCLYLGDIDLNSGTEQPGKSIILHYIHDRLEPAMREGISTIQIPHHGSQRNFNDELLRWPDLNSGAKEDQSGYSCRPMVYVISVGLKNRYRQPSGYVLTKLVHSGNIIKIVTEDPASAFTEKWNK